MADYKVEANNKPANELSDKLVDVMRTTKVVKGGRIFGFTALVVIGDGNGRVGFGIGKSREVPIAIQKANQSDVNALKGSSIRIDLKSNRNLKKGYLSLNDQKTPLKIRGKRAAGGFIFKEEALLKIGCMRTKTKSIQNTVVVYVYNTKI